MHLRNLAVVDVVIGRATMKLRGAAQALLARLSERSINVIEALTCAGELLVVIHESDLQRSVEALAIAKSRTSHV